MAKDNGSSGVGCFLIVALMLTCMFVTCKLGQIGLIATWSWWWVLSPLIIYFGFILGMVAIIIFSVLGFATIAGLIKVMKKTRK